MSRREKRLEAEVRRLIAHQKELHSEIDSLRQRLDQTMGPLNGRVVAGEEVSTLSAGCGCGTLGCPHSRPLGPVDISGPSMTEVGAALGCECEQCDPPTGTTRYPPNVPCACGRESHWPETWGVLIAERRAQDHSPQGCPVPWKYDEATVTGAVDTEAFRRMWLGEHLDNLRGG